MESLSKKWIYRWRRQRLVKRFPKEPWKWRPDWLRGVISYSQRGTTLLIWVLVLAWSGIISHLIVTGDGLALTERSLDLMPVFIWTGSAALLIAACSATFHTTQYGATRLCLQSVPGVVGGHLKVSVHLAKPFRARAPGQARLFCIRIEKLRGIPREELLWDDIQEIDPGLFEQRVIPLRFRVPQNAEPTTASNGDTRVEWRLQITAPARGSGFSAWFDVPVFRTSDIQGSELEMTATLPDDISAPAASIIPPAEEPQRDNS